MVEENQEKRLLNLNEKIKKIEKAMKLFLVSSRYEEPYNTARLKTLLSKIEHLPNDKSPLEEKIAKIIFNTFFDSNQKESYEQNEQIHLTPIINTQIGFSFMDVYYQEIWDVKWFCESFFDYSNFDDEEFIKSTEGYEYNRAILDYDFLECYAEKKGIINMEENLEKKVTDLEFEESVWENYTINELFEEEEIDEEILEKTVENFSKCSESLDTIMLSDIEKIKSHIIKQFIKSKNPDSEAIKKFKNDLIQEGEILFQQYREFQSYINKSISK